MLQDLQLEREHDLGDAAEDREDPDPEGQLTSAARVSFNRDSVACSYQLAFKGRTKRHLVRNETSAGDQPVISSSSMTATTPFPSHVALTTASCCARVCTVPWSTTMLPSVVAVTRLSSGGTC